MQILSIFPFLEGINQLHVAFLLDIVLLSLLFYKVIKNKKFIISKDIKFILILVWSFSYLLTCFYSIDKELSLLGFLKFFTVPIFITLLMQYDEKENIKEKIFNFIPKIGGAMVVIILLVTFFEKFILKLDTNVFFYQNRLAGFFSYANSFALFLLTGVIITGFKTKTNILDYVIINLLLVGILLANSRAIMIISAFSYLMVLIFNKQNRKKNLINLLVMVGITILVTYIMNNFGVANRISKTSVNSSEWILRILYYKDALRLLSKNIFGYGYMAFWYMQEGFQTGAYDTQFVHNGLLQIAVDTGVIAAISIVAVFAIGFFDKNIKARDRVLMIIILGHSLIDFNMEFLAITLILFMTLNFKNNIEITKIKSIKNTLLVGIVIYSFFSLVTTLNNFKMYDIGNKLFPYSLALNGELENLQDSNKSLEIAEKLYKKNKYFVNASYVISQKEQYFYNYEEAEKHEEWILSNKKYTMYNYIQYVGFLEKAINYYYNKNDYDNMKKYIEKLIDVPNKVQEVLDNSDSLALKIAHKPRLDIPEEMKEYIEQMKEFSKKLN